MKNSTTKTTPTTYLLRLFFGFLVIQGILTLLGAAARDTVKNIEWLPLFFFLFTTISLFLYLLTHLLRHELPLQTLTPGQKLLSALVLLLPLLFSTASTTAFIAIKLHFFLFIALLAIIHLGTNHGFSLSGDATSPLFQKVAYLFLLLLLAAGLRGFGQDSPGLLGNFVVAMEALLPLGATLVLLLLGAREATPANRRLLSILLTAGAIIPLCFGFYQYFELGHFGIFKDPGGRARIFSTLGNVNWFASYLLMIIFTAIAQALQMRKTLSIVFSWTMAFTSILLLIFTQSRGPWLAFAITMLLFAILLWKILRRNSKSAWQSLSKNNQRFVIALPILLLLLVLIYTSNSPLNREIDILHRLQISFKNEYNVQQRIHVWKTGLHLFQKNPVLGNGTGTFSRDFLEAQRDIFKDETDLTTLRYGGNARETHNDYLQILIENGVSGIILFLLLLLLPLRAGLITILSGERDDALTSLGFAAATTAVLCHAFVSFPFQLPVTRVFVFLLLGQLFLKNSPPQTIKNKSVNPILLVAVIFGSLLLTANLVADTQTSLAQEHMKHARLKEGQALLRSALAFNPLRGDTLFLLGTTLQTQGKFDEAEPLLLSSLRYTNDKGIATNLAFQYKRRGKHKEAKELFHRAFLYEPRAPETAYNLAMALLEENNQAEAMKMFTYSLTENPWYLDAWNQIGFLHLRNKNFKEAEAAFDEVATLDPAQAQQLNYSRRVYNYSNTAHLKEVYAMAYYGLAMINRKRSDFSQAEKFYLHSLSFSPNNVLVLYQKALLDLQMGKKAEGLKILHQLKNRQDQFGASAREQLKHLER